jgi:multidrug efflux pump subunit AcrB
VSRFLQGPLPVLVIVLSLLAGIVALGLTAREEEPQIVVPLADVLVSAPGLSAEQVERQVATPLEKLLYQIDGVEYVYSMSRESGTVVTVRFRVGEDRVGSLVKIYNKIQSNVDQVPPVVKNWVVKPVEIDDVPVVVATLWSEQPERSGDAELRRLAEEVAINLQSIQNTNRVEVVGGRPRTIRVELRPDALAARHTAPLEVAWALGVHNQQLPAGEIEQRNAVLQVEAGAFIRDARELEALVANVVDGVPVYLRDVAAVLDGPAEVDNYTWIGFGPASQRSSDGEFYPAVAISVAKKKGTNAVWVARDVERRLEELSKTLFPSGVHFTITRDNGETANEKVNELVEALVVAVLTVIIFIGLFLGWRAALVVALAVPVCYGATLLINLFFGYSINRVTLFALILALGLLVDDPITDVENIERYFHIGKWSPKRTVLLAVQEIRPALIMSTLAVILSFLPLFFITGMMGPYMRPMALNVPLTIFMSLIVAFCVTPYLSLKLLSHRSGSGAGGSVHAEYDVRRTPLYRIYDFLLRPLLCHRWMSWAFLSGIAALFALAVILPAFRLVPLKMLPFDNKNEFQIVVDMDTGVTLETTEAVTRELARYLRTVPEVKDFTGYVGLASPMDFNGLVRHYFLRKGAHVADLRVGLLPKKQRAQQSHEILLRIRQDLETLASRYNARIKLVELPAGPPVISTITAEIHGDPDTPYETFQQAARVTAERLRKEERVVEVDTSVEADQTRLLFVTDKEKAALSGVGTEEIAQTIALATGGLSATTLNIPTEVNALPVLLRLQREVRSSPDALASLYIKGRPGIAKIRQGVGLRDAPTPLVPLSELGTFQDRMVDKTIYHKNLERVAYVFADTAGRPPADVILDVQADEVRGTSSTTVQAGAETARPLAQRHYFNLGAGLDWSLPAGTRAVWSGEGEWKITLDVFRDLGIAFGAALVGMFIVLWLQTGSMVITAIMMLAIPLTMIGIMPGFWALNSFGMREIAGFPNPVYFTATAMIGMIALSGIVVRNSVVLVDFIHRGLLRGLSLEDALIESGAIRTRPIILTAGTAFLGNVVITLDPIFSGLAWSIIFGVTASTLFTLGVIPVVYHLVYAHRLGHGLPLEPVDEPDPPVVEVPVVSPEVGPKPGTDSPYSESTEGQPPHES